MDQACQTGGPQGSFLFHIWSRNLKNLKKLGLIYVINLTKYVKICLLLSISQRNLTINASETKTSSIFF